MLFMTRGKKKNLSTQESNITNYIRTKKNISDPWSNTSDLMSQIKKKDKNPCFLESLRN